MRPCISQRGLHKASQRVREGTGQPGHSGDTADRPRGGCAQPTAPCEMRAGHSSPRLCMRPPCPLSRTRTERPGTSQAGLAHGPPAQHEPASPAARKPTEHLLARIPARRRSSQSPWRCAKPLPSTSLTTHLTWSRKERKRTTHGAPGFLQAPQGRGSRRQRQVQAPGGGAARAQSRPGTPPPHPTLHCGC